VFCLKIVIADIIKPAQRQRRLAEEKVAQISLSIQSLGLLQPVVLTKDNVLVAGLHRLEACKRLGWQEIDCVIKEYNELEAELAEIDENLIRAELTVLERAEHLKRHKELFEAKWPETKAVTGKALAKKRWNATEINFAASFAAYAAAKTGVTERTIRQEVQIAANIADDVKEMIRGTPTENHKDNLIRLAKMDDGKQRLVGEKIRSGEAKNIKAAQKIVTEEIRNTLPYDFSATDDRYRILHGDFNDAVKDIELGSIDVIITDPPYSKKYLDVYEDLAIVAKRLLKPGGSLVVMIGQSYLPEVFAKMVSHMRYHWMLSYLTPGGQSAQMWHRKVNTFWKPLLWFTNGDYDGDWIGDVTKSAVNDNDKRFHNWGQSESGMADIINRFSKPGDTILDPFMGGGTTGIVAVKMNRKFIGIDKDEAAVDASKRRFTESVANATEG